MNTLLKFSVISVRNLPMRRKLQIMERLQFMELNEINTTRDKGDDFTTPLEVNTIGLRKNFHRD